MMTSSLFAVPANLTISESLYEIFKHYCTKNDDGKDTLDGAAFTKLCKDSPELTKYIGRADIDLIFSRLTKPNGVRRLDFDNFLDSLLELSVRIYPDEQPTIALANFLAKFIFALFDQPPSSDDVATIEYIIDELTLQHGDVDPKKIQR